MFTDMRVVIGNLSYLPVSSAKPVWGGNHQVPRRIHMPIWVLIISRLVTGSLVFKYCRWQEEANPPGSSARQFFWFRDDEKSAARPEGPLDPRLDPDYASYWLVVMRFYWPGVSSTPWVLKQDFVQLNSSLDFESQGVSPLRVAQEFASVLMKIPTIPIEYSVLPIQITE